MEWFSFILVMGAACLVLLSRRRRLPARASYLAWAAIAVTLCASLPWSQTMEHRQAVAARLAEAAPTQGRPGGYVSSDKCQACHPREYATWMRTFHRTMTQYPSPSTVVAKMDHVDLELDGEKYHLERRGNEFWAEMPDPDWTYDPRNAQRMALDKSIKAPRAWKQISLMTGSHRMQIYWVASTPANRQTVFPFAWLIADQRWGPVNDTFLRDPSLPSNPQTWNMNCIACHATGGQPRTKMDGTEFKTRTGELGIACEACHGPGEEHVRANHDPLRRAKLHQDKKAEPTITNPARLSPHASAQVCGQCHGIKWIPPDEPYLTEGFRYRPGQDLDQTTPIARPARLNQQPWLREPMRQAPKFLEEHYWSDGMIRISGREYNGMVDSACAERGKLTCLSCHSMHQSNPDQQLAHQRESNQDCLQCHEQFRSKLEQHTHHPAGSAGSQCYNCHMPYTTYGLMKAIRSHKIDVPTAQASTVAGRPNACNLCHLDKSLGWTSVQLAQWYGFPQPQLSVEQQFLSAAAVWALRGDAGQRALIAWSMGWEPARQASGQDWLAPYLAQLLEDPYATVRYISQRSLRRLPGFENLDYDFTSTPAARVQAREQVMSVWNHRKKTGDNHPELLITPQGGLQTEAFDLLLRKRDNRSMDLLE